MKDDDFSILILFQIIGLLDLVRERVSQDNDLVKLLNEAEDLLKHSELYATQLRDNFRVKPEEPVVADLITALLSVRKTTIIHHKCRYII